MNYFDIISQFQIDSVPVSCEPFGNGHINSTFVVKTQSGKRYILQRLSEEAFKDVPALMENISGVTEFLDAKSKTEGTVCHVLAPVKTADGEKFIHITERSDDSDAEAGFYRVSPFAENSISLEAPESDEDFYECAVAFGTFISDLADYPAETLHETIPDFHNTVDRYRIFHEALSRAKTDDSLSSRIDDAADEIRFALERENEAGTLQEMRDSGKLPTRVTDRKSVV